MPLILRLPQSTTTRIGIFGGTALLVFLAILIPSVTLRSTEEPISEEMHLVLEVLQEEPVIDTHNDLPYQMYSQVGNHIRLLDISQNLTGTLHTDIGRMKKGGMGAVFLAAYSPCDAQYKDGVEFGFTMIDLIRRLTVEYSDDFEMAYTAEDIKKVQGKGKIAILIGVEGGHMINSNLAILRQMYGMGVRYMTLTHSCHTPWADAFISDIISPETKHDDKYDEAISNGLSFFGKKVVLEMNRLGMMVDLSHVSAETMMDALKVSRAPVFFSHSSAFSVCPHRRNVNDQVLKMLKANNGVLMINFWNNVVRCSEDYKNATIDDVIEHFNYVKDLIGVDHLGMGADYDGVPIVPKGLEDVSKYPDLLEKLVRDHNWSREDIKKITGANILRVMRDVEKVAEELEATKANDDTVDYCRIVGSDNCQCKVMEDVTLSQLMEEPMNGK